MNILTNPIRYLLLSSMLLFSALASAELETIYYHNDHLGNPVAATSATGELMWQEEFTPYGTRQIKQDGGLNHIWYTGKELDADTGLVYFGARWYDPSIGQFLSVDPVGVIPGNRFSYNRYAYANNNPQKYIDPDGEFAQLIWGGLAGAAFDVALQGIAIASGTQDEFSWGQLGTSTLVGAGTGGLSVATKAVSIKRAVDARKATKGVGKTSDKAPDFVVSPGGTAFPVPKGATGPASVVNPGGKTTGNAFTGGKGGVNGKVDTMRIMNPTPPRGKSPGYPNGYIKYENKSGQGVDPYTGRTLSNKDSHFPID